MQTLTLSHSLTRSPTLREFRTHVLVYRSYWGELPPRALMRRFYRWSRHDYFEGR